MLYYALVEDNDFSPHSMKYIWYSPTKSKFSLYMTLKIRLEEPGVISVRFQVFTTRNIAAKQLFCWINAPFKLTNPLPSLTNPNSS